MRPRCFTVTLEFSDKESFKLLHSVALWTPDDALKSMKRMSVCREKVEKGIYIEAIKIQYFHTLKEALES